MPYVNRDSSGAVIGLSVEQTTECSEWVADENAPEVREFLARLGVDTELNRADLEFIRVLEDLMEVLMEKQVFLFTELPEEAQAKLLMRQSLRARHRGALNLLSDDETLI